jgi:hypothetical protein
MKNKIITIQVPTNIREWTDEEIAFLTGTKYKKKQFPNITAKTDRYMRTVISIIETNPADSKGYVHIPIDYLGEIFKSKQLAHELIDTIITTKMLDYLADTG